MALNNVSSANTSAQNYAAISAAISYLNSVQVDLPAVQSSVSQNTIALASLQSFRLSAGMTLSTYSDAIASLNSNMVGVFSRLSTYGDNIAGLNDLTRQLLLRADQADADIKANAKAVADQLVAAMAASAAASQEAAAARQMALISVLQVGQPARNPAAYARDAAPPATGVVALDPVAGVDTLLGRAYQFTGAATLTTSALIPWDPNRIWVVGVRYWRLADVLDPNNNAIDFGIQWLGVSDTELSRAVLHREHDLQVLTGPQLLTFQVPSRVGAAPALQPPKGALSWRPYLRIYGADGATAVGELSVRDASLAGVYAPDVDALANRISQTEGRLNVVADAQSRLGYFLVRRGDPTADDIPVGGDRVVKDLNTGIFNHWVNDGGTMVKLLTFTPVS